MPQSTITKMVCDLKGCTKSFLVDDAPNAKMPPGLDEVFRTVDSLGVIQVYCTREHALKDIVAFLKATPEERRQLTGQGKTLATKPLKISKANIEKLKAAGIVESRTESRAGAAVEELESLPANVVPPAPENLAIEEPSDF